MQGGVAQGIGWALSEEYIYDKNGKLDNPGFLDYRMPVASDLPMLDTVIIEVPNPKHPQGVRGVGEVPLVPVHGGGRQRRAQRARSSLRQPADVAAQGAGGAGLGGAVGESSRLTLALNQPARCAGKKNRENVHEAGHEAARGADRIGRGRRPAGRGRNAGAKRPLQGVAGARRTGEGRQAAAGRRSACPEKPLVVPVVEKVGEYGGVWRRAFLGPADANNYIRVVYDALFRFSPDGAKIEPKIAAGAEPSADFKTWTIKLRKGSKWSDGQPFTADDILFWYNDVLLNKELTPQPAGLDQESPTARPPRSRRSTTTTVRFTYAAPATLFLTAVANQDGADRTFAMFLPAHYLKKFHPAHAAKADIDKAVQAAGFKTWTELFANRNAPPENPERPTMAAWAPTSRASDPVFTLRRNPYYVGVDTAGNQLPYLDEVRFTYFADAQALNLAAIAGNFDMQERHINMTNYPVLKEQEKTGKYRVITWPTFGGADAVIAINQTYKADPEMGKVMATKDFRVALSLAINRDQIKESVFLGLGEARQGVPRAVASVLPGRRVRAEVHRVQARRGQQAARRHRPHQEGRPRHPPAAQRQAGDHRDQRRARPSAPGPTWRCWSPRTGRRSASRPSCRSASARCTSR